MHQHIALAPLLLDESQSGEKVMADFLLLVVAHVELHVLDGGWKLDPHVDCGEDGLEVVLFDVLGFVGEIVGAEPEFAQTFLGGQDQAALVVESGQGGLVQRHLLELIMHYR